MRAGNILITGTTIEFHSFPYEEADLVLCFGEKTLVENGELYRSLKTKFNRSRIVIFSTSGEISDGAFSEGTIAGVALQFDRTKVEAHSLAIQDFSSSFAIGESIANTFQKSDLAYIMLISDGSNVNGSELVRGVNENMQLPIPVTGGLAGDGNRFDYTLVGLDQAPIRDQVVAIGFYGNKLAVGHGSYGGWEPFGPEMRVSKSENNVLFEVDERSALDIYRDFLGDYSNDLPSSALLFPISLKVSLDSKPVVRTILSVDFENKSMTFAGDVPEGAYIRFMKSSVDKLIEAAATAAGECLTFGNNQQQDKFAFLVSCVGRKIVMGMRVEEEIEAVKKVLGSNTLLAGFYSYGEICPLFGNEHTDLHNQTMTITLLREEL